MAHYTDDVELVVPPGSSFPEVGTFKGRDAVGRWFGEWFRSFEPDYHFDIDHLVSIADGGDDSLVNCGPACARCNRGWG